MDNIDYKILLELSQDSSLSFKKIAKKVGLTSATVIERFEKMKRDRVFNGVNTIIDIKKIGYAGKTILFIKNVNIEDFELKLKKLCIICDVIMIINVMGKYDKVIMIAYKDTSEIFKAIEFLKSFEKEIIIDVAFTEDTQYPYKQDMKQSSIKLCQKLVKK